MQEFQVITNNYSASTGIQRAASSQCPPLGTNQFHGSLFESLQNDILNARNFFAATRRRYRLNQSADRSAPDPEDKTHFFVTWSGTRQLTSDTTASTVPTLLNRAGDSRIFVQTAPWAGLIYDPSTTAGTAPASLFAGT